MNTPFSALNPEQSAVLAHVVRCGMIPDAATWSAPSDTAKLFGWLSDEDQVRRATYLLELGKHIPRWGIQTPFEPDVLSIEASHPLLAGEVKGWFERLGYPPQYAEHFAKAGLSLVCPPMLATWQPQSRAVGLAAQQNLQGPIHLLDPLEGSLLWVADEAAMVAALGYTSWTKFLSAQRLERLDELLARPEAIYNQGLYIGADAFRGLVGARGIQIYRSGETPEVVVKSAAELDGLASQLADAARSRRLQVWYRGQATEYFLPDRSFLIDAGILPSTSYQRPSLIPSLYRYLDGYLESLPRYETFIKHVSDWVSRAGRLFGTGYTVRRGGQIIDDPMTAYPADTKVKVTFAHSGGPHEYSANIPDLGWKTEYEVYNEEGPVIDSFTKHHHLGLNTIRAFLVLQHYGCPTGSLDITQDARIAAWFALNQFEGPPEAVSTKHVEYSGAYPSQWPLIYVFALSPSIHPVVDTHTLLRGTAALRPLRQKCGLLAGAGNLVRNFPARYVSMKIRLAPGIERAALPPAKHLFPNADEDKVLESLLHYENQSAGHYDVLHSVYRFG